MKKIITYFLIFIFYINISFATSGEIDLNYKLTSKKSDYLKEFILEKKINYYVDKTYKSTKYIKQKEKLEKMIIILNKTGENDKVIILQKIIKSLDKKNTLFLKNQEEIRLEKIEDFKNNLGKILDFNGKLITRKDWGADESFGNPEKFLSKCGGNCWNKTNPKKMSKIDENYVNNFSDIDKKIIVKKKNEQGLILKYYPVSRIIVHHTAMPLAKTKEDGINQIKQIYKNHSLSLGWGDIGYQYLIDGEGNVYEGHSGGKYVVGSHVYGHNNGSIGISLMSSGEYTNKQLDSLKELVVYLAREYNLDITKKSKLRNYMLDGESMQNIVVAHKELDSGKPTDPNINMEDFRKDIINIYNNNFKN